MDPLNAYEPSINLILIMVMSYSFNLKVSKVSASETLSWTIIEIGAQTEGELWT